MSADALMNSAEDNAIWVANNPDAADLWEFKLGHWAKTGHINCHCNIVPDWWKGSGR